MTGESGLGKTTFINNLVSSYRTTRGQPHDGSTTSLSAFQVGAIMCKLAGSQVSFALVCTG
jgi:septin family protein